MATTPDQLHMLDQLMRLSPHNQFLGIHQLSLEDHVLTAELPYRNEFVGNPVSGAMHGGVISAMLDACCGLAVMVKLGRLTRIATLDFRIDYLKPTTRDRTLYSRAECYKLTREVAFVQGAAYEKASDGTENEVARAAGNFMLLTAREKEAI